MITTNQIDPSLRLHSLDQKLVDVHHAEKLADIGEKKIEVDKAAAVHLSTPAVRLHQPEQIHHDADLEALQVADHWEEHLHERKRLPPVHRPDPLADLKGHHHQGETRQKTTQLLNRIRLRVKGRVRSRRGNSRG